MKQATPRPWIVSSGRGTWIYRQLEGGLVQWIATVDMPEVDWPSPEEQLANAALIVRAVNNHEALLARLQDMVVLVNDEIGTEQKCWDCEPSPPCAAHAQLRDARAAIEEATRGQQG